MQASKARGGGWGRGGEENEKKKSACVASLGSDFRSGAAIECDVGRGRGRHGKVRAYKGRGKGSGDTRRLVDPGAAFLSQGRKTQAHIKTQIHTHTHTHRRTCLLLFITHTETHTYRHRHTPSPADLEDVGKIGELSPHGHILRLGHGPRPPSAPPSADGSRLRLRRPAGGGREGGRRRLCEVE